MIVYLRTLVQIALRRLGPEDLPDSALLLGLTFAAYLALQLPLVWLAYRSPQLMVMTIVIIVALLLAWLWLLLRVTGYPNRFRQTLTAILGTSALLSALSLPLSTWQSALLRADIDPAAPSLLLLAVMIWSIIIDGHILARALSRPFLIGLLLSISYFFISTFILFELLPEEVPGATG